MKNLALAQSIASTANQLSQERMKTQFDKTTKPTKIKVGNQVLVHDPTNKKGLLKKLSDHYLGPYTLVKQMSPVHFELDGMPVKKAKLVHVNRMKLYPEPDKHSLLKSTFVPHSTATDNLEPEASYLNDTCPPNDNPPELACETNVVPDDSLTTEIPEKRIILNHRRRGNNVEYLVLEDPDQTASAIWIKAKDLCNRTLIDKYLDNRPDRPRTRATISRQSQVSAISDSPRAIIISPTFISMCLLVCFYSMEINASPVLGPLYNCDITQYLGVYTGVTTFQAKIMKYRPVTTQISLVHCVLNYVTLYCAEIIFTVKNKRVSNVARNINITICKQAISSMSSPFGALKLVAPDTWISDSPRQYKKG